LKSETRQSHSAKSTGNRQESLGEKSRSTTTKRETRSVETPMARTTSVIRVFDFMSTDLVTARTSEPLNEAVQKMLRRDVGCIVVTENQSVVGIITKGDVLRKAFLKGLDARQVTAKNAMSSPVVTVDHDATIEEAARLMSTKNVSKLPVVKEGNLVGIITSTDIIRAEPMQVGYLQELVRARFVPHEMRAL